VHAELSHGGAAPAGLDLRWFNSPSAAVCKRTYQLARTTAFAAGPAGAARWSAEWGTRLA
jgi:hypothetical protein